MELRNDLRVLVAFLKYFEAIPLMTDREKAALANLERFVSGEVPTDIPIWGSNSWR